MIEKSIIKFIEDDYDDAQLYKEKLESEGSLIVELVDPREFPIVSEYDKILFVTPQAIIIDQKISMYAGVPYEGLDIAEFLRSLNPMIPIFILTNYEKETSDLASGWSIEYIIAKSKFKTKNQVKIHIKRILRAVGRYEDALSKKTKIFKELIDKKVSGTISTQEEKELNKIRSEFERVFAVTEDKQLGKIGKTEKELEVLDKILEELKKLSKSSK